MSLNDLLREPEDRLASLKEDAELHGRLAEHLHQLYMDNAMAGSYQQPFDHSLDSYAMRKDEEFDDYCNRIFQQSEELREKASREEEEAKRVEAEVIPQIICDYNAGHRRRTPSMRKPFPNHGLCPFTESEEKHFRNPV